MHPDLSLRGAQYHVLLLYHHSAPLGQFDMNLMTTTGVFVILVLGDAA